MSHYSTLQDFQFAADVKDIRGAALYGEDQQKIGKVADIVFDHETAIIQYLVADVGHDRRVLIPVGRLYRTAVDENAFETDLSAAELDLLPAFTDKVFESDDSWKNYEQLHSTAVKNQKESARREVKEKWEEKPVLHMEGTDRIITPDEPVRDAGPVQTQAGRIGIPASELFPDRLTDKFPSTAPSGEKLTLMPEESARVQNAALSEEHLGPRWNTFQEALRAHLTEIKCGCETCGESPRRVA